MCGSRLLGLTTFPHAHYPHGRDTPSPCVQAGILMLVILILLFTLKHILHDLYHCIFCLAVGRNHLTSTPRLLLIVGTVTKSTNKMIFNHSLLFLHILMLGQTTISCPCPNFPSIFLNSPQNFTSRHTTVTPACSCF